MIRTIAILLIFSFSYGMSYSQRGIRFVDGSLAAVLGMAKDKGKNIFIDTYADWCKPCKRMDKKFKNREVAKFFNEHYINYRVNMQNPTRANELRRKYDVVFLPTLYILDPDGEVKYYTDQELSVEELLLAGQQALDPKSYNVSNGTVIRRNDGTISGGVTPKIVKPKKSAGNKKSVPDQHVADNSQNKKKETQVSSISEATRRAQTLDQYETVDQSSTKILAVLGAGEMPPEVLRQEAYLRLEFMDGSSRAVAKKYLATQDNWATDENRKFILDFINNTESEEYQYLIAQKEDFVTQFGVDRVRHSLEILTYKTLHNRIPRPTLEEAIQLYENIELSTGNRLAHFYYVNRLADEENTEELLAVAAKYIKDNETDHEFRYIVASYVNALVTVEKNYISSSVALMKYALELNPESVRYMTLLSDLYAKNGNLGDAKKIIDQAISQAEKQGIGTKTLKAKKMSLSTS